MERVQGHGKIELLAPARDLQSARAAIDCGADAVYMGGPRFGARQAAGNSVADIAAAVEYARRFGVRVYVTLNTVLFDDELAEAERVARQVIAAGADALIVQDMAYAEMGLQGVELHASTQMFNASPEKAAFLAGCGFSRVILERNLSLREIRRIRAATDVELECFVHGAICVCYSGRCYMSRTMSPRSGNRGDCMQACRLPYDLLGADGEVLMAGKHLLSVRDMDLSGRLGELLDAGVTSFKIEGRLKDESYVRNVIAWYRTRLDREIAARPGLTRASEGRSVSGFEPDIARTFSRGHTEYFFDGRRAGVSTPDTPKAVGSLVCRVARSGAGWFEPQGEGEFVPGDGICFLYGGGLSGTNVNGVQGRRVCINREWCIPPGTEIYRNYDRRFTAQLEAARTRRSVGVEVTVTFDEGGVQAEFRDDDGFSATASVPCTHGAAREPARVSEMLRTQLSRSGDTMFDVMRVRFGEGAGEVPFLRVSEANALRREGLDELLRRRVERTPERWPAQLRSGNRYPYGVPAASENVTNRLARRFYDRFGGEGAAPGYDLQTDLRGVTVMRTPFCVRREHGMCLKGRKGTGPSQLRLRHGAFVYRLEFDCAECMMSVVFEGRARDTLPAERVAEDQLKR